MTVLGCMPAYMAACSNVHAQFCPGQEGMFSLSAAEIHQEPLELDENPQSQGSSGVCSKFFRRMVFFTLSPPPRSLSFSAHIW